MKQAVKAPHVTRQIRGELKKSAEKWGLERIRNTILLTQFTLIELGHVYLFQTAVPSVAAVLGHRSRCRRECNTARPGIESRTRRIERRANVAFLS